VSGALRLAAVVAQHAAAQLARGAAQGAGGEDTSGLARWSSALHYSGHILAGLAAAPGAAAAAAATAGDAQRLNAALDMLAGLRRPDGSAAHPWAAPVLAGLRMGPPPSQAATGGAQVRAPPRVPPTRAGPRACSLRRLSPTAPSAPRQATPAASLLRGPRRHEAEEAGKGASRAEVALLRLAASRWRARACSRALLSWVRLAADGARRRQVPPHPPAHARALSPQCGASGRDALCAGRASAGAPSHPHPRRLRGPRVVPPRRAAPVRPGRPSPSPSPGSGSGGAAPRAAPRLPVSGRKVAVSDSGLPRG
jgi:hypothetical protein